jgi:hypothetical protein
MLPTPEENETFEEFKEALLDGRQDEFAVVFGRTLLGVVASLEQGLELAAEALEDGRIPEGAPILISEIAVPVKVRVVAEMRPRSLPPAA